MGMSPSQKALLKAWKDSGGIYKVAAEELEKEFEEEEREHGSG
jgi:hypothetical protein